MPSISNYTFEEITLGQTATHSKTVDFRDIQLFAAVSGDLNPVHLDPEYAGTTPFGGCIAHGMLSGAIVSAALAMALPGPGSIYRSQSIRFRKPVYPGDTLNVQLEVVDKQERQGLVTLDCKVSNQHGALVASGKAEVVAPREKLSLPLPELPAVSLSS